MSVEEDERLDAPAGLPMAILGAVTDGITVQAADGRLVWANDAAARLTGFESAAELLGAPLSEFVRRFELLDEHRRPLAPELLPGRIALLEGREVTLLVCYRIRATGEERWSSLRSLPIQAADGQALVVNVIRDITEQRVAGEQMRLLADASELLVSNLDFALTIGAIGGMLVPTFADYALIDLLAPDGTLEQVVLRHVDPEREKVLREIRERYPPNANHAHPASVVVRSGSPLLIETAADPELARAALDAEHLELYRRLDPSSYLVVPLIARSRTIGTLSLGMGESGRRYREADILFAQEVAGRIALGVDNSRLYAEAGHSVDRLRLLAEAGEVFASSLDREEILGRVARLVVPWIADACNIYLAEDRALVRVAHAHTDPGLERLMDEMTGIYLPEGEPPALWEQIVGRGEALLASTLTAEVVDALGSLGLDLDLFARVGSKSMMFVPFVSRGETLGVITLGSQEEGRYTSSDLELAFELARRASAAIENARLLGELSFRTSVLEAQQESSLDGQLLVSAEGELISFNRRFAELWGFSEALVEGRSDEAALAEAMTKVVDPESFLERVHYLYANPEAPSQDEVALRDGTVLDRYGSGVVGPDGHYYGYLWSFRDITEKKRIEAELEHRAETARALEFVADGVFLLDADRVVRLWNPAAEAITGLRDAEVVGRRLEEAIPAWVDVERLVPVADTRHGGGTRAETVPVEIGGRELWLSISGVAFGEGVVYACRDLTEERAVERLKSDFVSTVSHELRTPLAAIYGAAMTLRREDVPLNEEQRSGMLGVVASESERLARIVNDILLASRLDSDVVDLSLEQEDPVEIARAVVAAAATHLPDGIELAFRAPEGLPPISTDADKVRQVLVNLVENAIKYSPDGGLVTVTVDRHAERMRFSVVDHGLGIPASEHGRIFEKFYRLDPNLTRGVGGTGLGLYICREIVRRIDGRIWVTSEPGRGSTFAFELPLA